MLAIAALFAFMLVASVFGSTDTETIATVLVLEAGSNAEPQPQAMIAVANVLGNRARLKGTTPATEATRPYQFSCWKAFDDATGRAKRHPNYKAAIGIAKRLQNHSLGDITNGATHYENIGRFGTPAWARRMTQVSVIGSHRFYR